MLDFGSIVAKCVWPQKMATDIDLLKINKLGRRTVPEKSNLQLHEGSTKINLKAQIPRQDGI